MTNEAIYDEVKKYYENNLPEGSVLTTRMVNSFVRTLNNMIKEERIMDNVMGIKDALSIGGSKNFILQNQPYLEPISDRVKSDVCMYFMDSSSLSEYTDIEICRKSNYKADSYLYCIIAKGSKDGSYSCWSSWNDSARSLNHGHYNLPDRDTALNIIKVLFNDITDEIEKYGPEQTLALASSEDILYSIARQYISEFTLHEYGSLPNSINIESMEDIPIAFTTVSDYTRDNDDDTEYEIQVTLDLVESRGYMKNVYIDSNKIKSESIGDNLQEAVNWLSGLDFNDLIHLSDADWEKIHSIEADKAVEDVKQSSINAFEADYNKIFGRRGR